MLHVAALWTIRSAVHLAAFREWRVWSGVEHCVKIRILAALFVREDDAAARAQMVNVGDGHSRPLGIGDAGHDGEHVERIRKRCERKVGWLAVIPAALRDGIAAVFDHLELAHRAERSEAVKQHSGHGRRSEHLFPLLNTTVHGSHRPWRSRRALPHAR